MKAVIVKACEQYKAGDIIECTAEEFTPLFSEGLAITETEHNANQQVIRTREAAVDAAIKASKAFGPKEDTKTVRARAILLETAKAGDGLDYIASLPARADSNLDQRVTASGEQHAITRGDETLQEAIHGYLKASEPFEKCTRNGGIIRAAHMSGNREKGVQEAIELSRARAIQSKKLADMVTAGADFKFDKDLIKAADYADPAASNPLGVLNTGLTLQWNLGFLANQLVMLDDIVTDVSNTPALFNQVVRTRYLTVPKVQLKTTTNAWSGSTGSAVDVNVVMDTHAGVPITINENILGATARQLFNEQKSPQLYSLGEYIIYKMINCAYNGSTRIANDGTTTSTIKFTTTPFSVAGATLKTFTADLPEAMDEAKLPGGDEPAGTVNLQRFAWVHGRLYASAAGDTNFLLNQSIQGIKGNGTNGNLLETGRFERLGNLNFRKSQLVTDQCTATGSGADATTNGIVVSPGTFANATYIGLAGTRNALMFVSRVPSDYTKVLPEIPSTAAIELVTEPKTGITFLVIKYLDHAYETANMRVQLMFGQAIGDERQAILLAK